MCIDSKENNKTTIKQEITKTEPELPKVDHENQKNVNQHYKRLMSTKVTKCDVVDVMSQ